MIVRFQIVSVLIFIKIFMIAWSLGVILYAIYESNKELLLYGLAMIASTLIVAISQWILAARTRCPLCLTPVLAHKSCSKNRNARPLMGSYRLRVATAVLFKGWFRCPYCNEPSALKVREKN
jgi:cytochrome bd-type quinol oxidase subunit 1